MNSLLLVDVHSLYCLTLKMTSSRGDIQHFINGLEFIGKILFFIEMTPKTALTSQGMGKN